MANIRSVLLYVSLYTSYDSQCPHSSQWNLRALHDCNAIPHYYCLFDENRLKYSEFCRKNQDFEGPVNTEFSRKGSTREKTANALTCLVVSVILATLLICYNIVTLDIKTDTVIDKRELQHTRGICIEEVNTLHFEKQAAKKQPIHLDYFGEETHTDIVLNTKVLLRIYITLKDAKITVISGPPGCGKTSFLYHAAMKLGEADNYKICFVSNPVKLIQTINIDEKQIFVIDDIGGENSLKENSLQSWRANADSISQTVSQSLKTKLILTCRSYIYSNEKFSLLKIPHMHCDILHMKGF
ncbi:uncharacterized protein [Mytilus edulis]|uniref:uncharacterized protein n=1 Tax=Mytilus edulis TaxID=6550 RepID=UPI0039F0B8A1